MPSRLSMTTEHHSQSPAETVAIGLGIGLRLKGNEIIFLDGDLGAGKTLLTKGIAQGLGIDPEDVVSPSFTLANQFDGRDGIRLHHIDLYRLGPSVGGGSLPEIDDYLGEAVIVIEWAQYLDPSYLSLRNAITAAIRLDPQNPGHRRIKITQL